MSKNKVLILGVTASGKSRLAFDLAKSTGAEIISVDSMKVYRRMDIGTAKPDKQARKQIKYHLLDVVEPSESFSVAKFLDLAGKAAKQINKRNNPVIAVGGTALYIKALLYGLFEGPGSDEKIRAQLQAQTAANGLAELYRQLEKADPAAARNIHPNDSKRIIRALEVYRITGEPISGFQKQWADEPRKGFRDWTVIGLRKEKAQESKRINARVKRMIEAGLVGEVEALLAEEKPLSKQARCAIGYAEIIEYLDGKTTLEEAVELIKKNTRRLAKSQRTWFKTFENVHWLDIDADESPEEIFKKAEKLLEDTKSDSY